MVENLKEQLLALIHHPFWTSTKQEDFSLSAFQIIARICKFSTWDRKCIGSPALLLVTWPRSHPHTCHSFWLAMYKEKPLAWSQSRPNQHPQKHHKCRRSKQSATRNLTFLVSHFFWAVCLLYAHHCCLFFFLMLHWESGVVTISLHLIKYNSLLRYRNLKDVTDK